MLFWNFLLGLVIFAIGVIVGVYGSSLFEGFKRGNMLDSKLVDQEVQTQVISDSDMSDEAPLPIDEDSEIFEDSSKDSIPEINFTEEDHAFANRLMELIEKKLDQRSLQVDELASEMAMSHTSFYERVNRVMGMSPAQLIRNSRLNRAHEMLTKGGKTVAEVALLCGFSDAKYFSTIFKKRYRVSPSRV